MIETGVVILMCSALSLYIESICESLYVIVLTWNVLSQIAGRFVDTLPLQIKLPRHDEYLNEWPELWTFGCIIDR